MKYLIILLIILAAGFFYPQLVQSVGGPCQALEAKIADEIGESNMEAGVIAGLFTNLSNGEIGRQIASEKYEMLPTSIGCAVGYYHFDPRELAI